MEGKVQAVGLEEDQDGGTASKGREKGSRRGLCLQLHPHDSAGAWCLDEKEKGKEKSMDLSLRNVLHLEESLWRDPVTQTAGHRGMGALKSPGSSKKGKR